MNTKIPVRTLGKTGLDVSAIGLDCMGMTYAYDNIPGKKEMISLLQAAATPKNPKRKQAYNF